MFHLCCFFFHCVFSLLFSLYFRRQQSTYRILKTACRLNFGSLGKKKTSFHLVNFESCVATGDNDCTIILRQSSFFLFVAGFSFNLFEQKKTTTKMFSVSQSGRIQRFASRLESNDCIAMVMIYNIFITHSSAHKTKRKKIVFFLLSFIFLALAKGT